MSRYTVIALNRGQHKILRNISLGRLIRIQRVYDQMEIKYSVVKLKRSI